MTDPVFNLADLFEQVVDSVPDHEALVQGSVRLTYAALEERANRFAHSLTAGGVQSGDHVGLLLHNCTEYLEAMIGCWKVRAVPININYRYTARELAYVFDNADLVALVHHRALTPQIDEAMLSCSPLRHLVVVEDRSGSPVAGRVDYETALAASSPDRDFAGRSADDHYILYTGGTTGFPKGVVWRHEDIFYAAMGGGNPGGPPITDPRELRDKATEAWQVSLPIAPFMHASGQWGSFGTFFSGGTVVIAPERFDAVAVWRLIAAERVTSVTVIGDAVGRPLVSELERNREVYDVSSLVAVASGGSILSPDVKQRFLRLLPGVFVIDGFGSSETGAQGTMMDTAGTEASRPLTFTVANTTTVLDDELRPAAAGVIGQIARRGSIPLGYYKDPEKTASTFVEVDGVRWSLPGDMGFIGEDGSITVLGRGSLSINTGGEKVYPEEVEIVLRGHPDVVDALVAGERHERWGQQVTAVVQTMPGALVVETDIVDHCRGAIAGYKVPRRIVFVDEIRRSPAGKGDYAWVASILAASPDIEASDALEE